MLYLGIDQHHRQITVSVRSETGAVIERRQVSTRPEKTCQFLDGIREQAGAEGFMAILEVCGFNDWLIMMLQECGCREIVLVHPDKRSKRKIRTSGQPRTHALPTTQSRISQAVAFSTKEEVATAEPAASERPLDVFLEPARSVASALVAAERSAE